MSNKVNIQDEEGSISTLAPLQTGDRLTLDEFERRYEAMPSHIKAELIEGVVFVSSPVRHDVHGRPHGQIMLWLGTYAAATPGIDLGDNSTVRLDNSEVQPDALLRLEATTGGQSSIGDDGFVGGAPELVAEVAASSAAYDLDDKQKMYRRNGVQEYLVWSVYDNQITWFRLREGEYVPLQPDASGLIRSEVFPGLQLDVAALLAGDLARVLAALQQGLRSTEHAAFVEQLAARRKAILPGPE